MPQWDPGQYLRFVEERTRPCRELVARIGIAAPRRIIDLGCGPGNSTDVLAERWPDAELTGFDSSMEMVAAARNTQPSRRWLVGDIAEWSSGSEPPYDIVFSNAALQWVPNHAEVFPRLLGKVSPGGVLAIQVPCNFDSPAQRIARELAASSTWRAHFPAEGVRQWQIHDAAFYYDLLAQQSSRIDLWETVYLQVMPDVNAIVEWYKGTGLRPFLESLLREETRVQFLHEYHDALRRAYPVRADGQVLFAFRRLFLIASRGL
jgi:trans-aconitate 2-methyltransferase